jgi:hypothetical protein
MQITGDYMDFIRRMSRCLGFIENIDHEIHKALTMLAFAARIASASMLTLGQIRRDDE